MGLHIEKPGNSNGQHVKRMTKIKHYVAHVDLCNNVFISWFKLSPNKAKQILSL